MHQRDTTHFLLVEDDRQDALSIQKALDCRNGVECTVCIARDGQEAMDYLMGRNGYENRSKYPLPNVVLLDLKMPRVDGFTFMEWLRNDAPGDLHMLPVIVVSDSTDQEDIDRCYALGVNSYLTKTRDPAQFATNIRALKEYWIRYARIPNVSK